MNKDFMPRKKEEGRGRKEITIERWSDKIMSYLMGAGLVAIIIAIILAKMMNNEEPEVQGVNRGTNRSRNESEISNQRTRQFISELEWHWRLWALTISACLINMPRVIWKYRVGKTLESCIGFLGDIITRIEKQVDKQNIAFYANEKTDENELGKRLSAYDHKSELFDRLGKFKTSDVTQQLLQWMNQKLTPDQIAAISKISLSEFENSEASDDEGVGQDIVSHKDWRNGESWKPHEIKEKKQINHDHPTLRDIHLFSSLCYENYAQRPSIAKIRSIQRLCPTRDGTGETYFAKMVNDGAPFATSMTWTMARFWSNKINMNGIFLTRCYQWKLLANIGLSMIGLGILIICFVTNDSIEGSEMPLALLLTWAILLVIIIAMSSYEYIRISCYPEKSARTIEANFLTYILGDGTMDSDMW
jgi:hypothetical protein